MRCSEQNHKKSLGTVHLRSEFGPQAHRPGSHGGGKRSSPRPTLQLQCNEGIDARARMRE